MAKSPRRKADPPTGGKFPRQAPHSADAETISWHLSAMDKEGPFGWGALPGQVFWETIAGRLKSFETMTWAQITGPSGSHFVPIENIVPEAQMRLEEIGQSDTDYLFSLRVGGKPRIWGIRDRHILKVLWWDPDHAVCPSQKKHT